MFSPGELLGDVFNTGSISAFPTAPAGNVATDMQVQAGTSAPVGTNTNSGGTGPTNSTAAAGSKANLRMSAAIVIAALVLLWLLGGIVFKGVSV